MLRVNSVATTSACDPASIFACPQCGMCHLVYMRYRHGGGVTIYIRNNPVYINGNDVIPDILEVEVKKPRMKALLVCSWYRAPNLCVVIFDHFEIFLQNIEHENKDVNM